MNTLTAVFLSLFIGGVAAPVGALLVVADIDTAGKVHALKVAKAERVAAERINGRISVARWKAGEF